MIRFYHLTGRVLLRPLFGVLPSRNWGKAVAINDIRRMIGKENNGSQTRTKQTKKEKQKEEKEDEKGVVKTRTKKKS